MPGPRPKPAELEKLEGYPGKGRRKSKAAIENLPELDHVGQPFDDMSVEAKRKWSELARDWSIILKSTDREFLRLYCETWVDMIESQRMVETMGKTVTGFKGDIKTAPWATRLNQAREAVRKLLMEFGATPSARQKVLMDKGGSKGSKFDGLIN